jgi:hypothetical protein
VRSGLNASCRGWKYPLKDCRGTQGLCQIFPVKIQLFNAAYKIAWDLAIEHKAAAYGLAAKLNDAVRAQMKDGNTDPAVIGEAAFKSLTKS